MLLRLSCIVTLTLIHVQKQSCLNTHSKVRCWRMQAERQAKLREVKACEEELQQCQAQLEQHADNDPDRFKGMRE